MDGYEVTVDDLRRTAGKYDAIREDLDSSKLPDLALGPDRVGHIEAASWFKDELTKSQGAQESLDKGLGSLAEYLRDKAQDYEQADLGSADLIRRGSWAEGGGSSRLTPTPYVWGQSSGTTPPLPHIYGQDGAQSSPLTPPPSSPPKAE